MAYEDDDYNDPDIIQEAPEYSPKSDFSKAEMVKLAVMKCIEMRAQEMKAGFWNTKLTKDGFPIKEWKADSRKQFVSSVDALRSLMNPEILRDSIFKKAQEKFIEQLKKLWDSYAYEEMQLTMKQDGKTYGGVPIYKKTGRKYMPDVGANVVVPENVFSNQASAGKGLWDERVNAYWDNLLFLYDQIFATLNDLIDRNNYFKQKLVYG